MRFLEKGERGFGQSTKVGGLFSFRDDILMNHPTASGEVSVASATLFNQTA